MGPQQALSDPARSAPPRARGLEDPLTARELPRALFVGVAVAATALLVALSRHVFLFWDDFVFLGEAREGDLSWGYLTDPLFRHFSPVVRLLDLLVVDAVPNHPWVIQLGQALLLASVVASVTWLMVVLHGRTGPALVGALVLAPSLTLLPLGNWWTAGVNIMPALVGFYVAFGAMVQLLRGRSRLYAVPCLLGTAVGVLDYELPMLLFGYLALWFLLFGSRVTPEPRMAALRRTWWVWLGVTAICVAALVNYRLNYYDAAPRPGAVDVLHGLARSLVRTLIPTALGFHDPSSDAFSALSLVIGCVVLVLLVGWLLVSREEAWRGLLFAGAGWLLPTLALVLNRVTFFGIGVVDNAIYFHLPTALFVVGLLEAWRAPRRHRRRALARPPVGPAQRALISGALLAVLAGYAWSAGPTAEYQLPPGATPDFVERARASVASLRAKGEPFSVLNSDVPPYVAPGDFKPFNRADQVLGVTAPPVTFDSATPPYYRVSGSGDLVPVDVDWLEDAAADSGDLRLLDAEREPDADEGLCFTANDLSSVLWPLEAPMSGPDLVVRTLAGVDEPTSVRVVVRGDGTDGFDRANPDEHTLTPERAGVVDTVAAPSVSTVRIKGFAPGARICLESLALGRVTPTG